MRRFSAILGCSSRSSKFHDNPPPYIDRSDKFTLVPCIINDAKPQSHQVPRQTTPDYTDNTTQTSSAAETAGAPETLLTIAVGHPPTHYIVRKSSICAESAWIRHQLELLPAEIVSCALRGHDPKCFEMIVHWLNTRQLPEDFDDHLVAFYRASQVLCMARLSNDIMDATSRLLYLQNRKACPSLLWTVHQAGLMNSPLYRFCLDSVASDLLADAGAWLDYDRIRKDELEEMLKNHALTTIVMKHILRCRLKAWFDPRTAPQCDYHDHSAGCKHWTQQGKSASDG